MNVKHRREFLGSVRKFYLPNKIKYSELLTNNFVAYPMLGSVKTMVYGLQVKIKFRL